MPDQPLSGQPAGSPTKHCPFLGKKKPVKDTPCDLQEITAQLSDRTGALTVRNHLRHAALEPPAGVTPEEAVLLQAHAVVIVKLVGYGAADSGAASGHDPHSEMNALPSRKGHASAHVRAAERCEAHPQWIELDDQTKGPEHAVVGLSAKAKDLKLDAGELTFPALLRKLWAGQLHELIKPAEAACVFDFWSCGFPSSGAPLGEATAYLSMRAMDDWLFSYRWAEGFRLKFGQTSMRMHAYRDGASVSEDTTTTKAGGGGSYSSSEDKTTVVSKDGSGVLYRSGKAQAEDDDDKGTTEHSARREREDSEKGAGDKLSEKFEALGKSVDQISSGDGLALKVMRNGSSQIDTDELTETIEKIKNFIDSILDLIRRVMSICRTACKAGIPVSVTFSFEMDVRAFQGTLDWHRYDTEGAPLKGDAYHLGRSQSHWAWAVALKPLEGSFTATIEFEAKVVHKAIAAVSIKVEAKWKGFTKAQLSIDDGTQTGRFMAGGTMWGTISATGEVGAATFYVQATATASSGIEHAYKATLTGANLHVTRNNIQSRRLGFQVSARWGNKVWDFLGLSSDEPDWQWPSDGPFILIEEGALDQDLRAYASD